MTNPTADDLRERLRPYGVRHEEEVVVLDERAEPRQQIRYLDLIRPRVSGAPGLWPRAVVEVEGQPVLYVVDNLHRAQPGALELARLRRILAFRAGADYVALAEPGRLTVYPVAPSEPECEPEPVDSGSHLAPALIPSLAFPQAGQDTPSPRTSTAAAVHKLLYDLLTDTTQALTRASMDPPGALSLVGRALFIRFLVDRRVLDDRQIQTICGAPTEECFSSAARAAQMCQWLDETFNGDFLPLPRAGSVAWFRSLPAQAFETLSRILYRTTRTGQLHLRWGDEWNDLLFNHIPVGLLSQVYEHHAHLFDPDLAQITSVRYTPRHLAEYMVDEVFFPLGDRARHARVLDPAVGGGVFLVAAFRRLAAEHWRADGRPPDTRRLRRILYEQLRGFDISEPALRLCSLGMYLTAIELDPSPQPLKSLRFDKPLLGTVLHDVRAERADHLYIGSLARGHIGDEHHGQYDIVIGNPPWNSWRPTERVSQKAVDAQVVEVEETVREIISERLGPGAARSYNMTDKVPDLPFLWRAMEWARPGGQIALALHGRLLFKQSEQGRKSRDEIFHAIRVTAVLNGTAVRDTQFWPGVRAPFCLLFARNEPPPEDSSFWFVSPELEQGLNQQGRLRIDSASAQPVTISELRERPTLLKTLFRGTQLDLTILSHVEQLHLTTLAEYWEQRGWKEFKGQGFKVGGSSREQQPARELWGKPELTRDQATPYLVEVGDLPTVPKGRMMQYPRKESLYKAPLVVVPKSLPKDRREPGAYLAFEDVVYNESFTGFSCHAHQESDLLARYLFLLFNSRLHVYFSLLTSGQFGTERDVVNVEDVFQFPFRPLENLPENLKALIIPLSQSLLSGAESALDEIEAWAALVYGLSRWDREVIHDTLEVALPFAHARARAQRTPEPGEVQRYVDRVCTIIQPFLGRHGRRITGRVLISSSTEPWIVLQFDSHAEGQEPPQQHKSTALARIINQADSLAASSIIAVHPPATLIVAVVAQYRYFTPTRARLLGLELVNEHSKTLLGEVI